MCHVHRMQTCLFRITTSELLQILSLSTTDVYVTQRKSRWAGHVIRMPWDRFPRKMISSWVRSKRPKGCPSYRQLLSDYQRSYMLVD